MIFSARNYRSLGDISIDFKNGINVVLAPNEHGKTNIALAIMQACLGTASNGETIFLPGDSVRDGTDHYHLSLQTPLFRVEETYRDDGTGMGLRASWAGDEFEGTHKQIRDQLTRKLTGQSRINKDELREAFMLRLFLTPASVSLVTMGATDRLAYLLNLFGIEELFRFRKQVAAAQKAAQETRRHALISLESSGTFTDISGMEAEFAELTQRLATLENPSRIPILQETYRREFEALRQGEAQHQQQIARLEGQISSLPDLPEDQLQALQGRLSKFSRPTELPALKRQLAGLESGIPVQAHVVEGIKSQIGSLQATMPDMPMLRIQLQNTRPSDIDYNRQIDATRRELEALKLEQRNALSQFETIYSLNKRALSETHKEKFKHLELADAQADLTKARQDLAVSNEAIKALSEQVQQRRFRCPHPNCGRDVAVYPDRLAVYDGETLLVKIQETEALRDELKAKVEFAEIAVEHVRARAAISNARGYRERAEKLGVEIDFKDLELKTLEADAAAALALTKLWSDFERGRLLESHLDRASDLLQKETLAFDQMQHQFQQLKEMVQASELLEADFELEERARSRKTLEEQLRILKSNHFLLVLRERLSTLLGEIQQLEANRVLFERKFHLEGELLKLRAQNQVFMSFQSVRDSELQARQVLDHTQFLNSELKTLLPAEILFRKAALEREINIASEALGGQGDIQIDLDLTDDGIVKEVSLFRIKNGQREEYKSRLSTGARTIMRTAISIGLHRTYPAVFNGLDFVMFDDPGLGVYGHRQEKFYQGITSLLSGKVIVFTANEMACEYLQPSQVVRLRMNQLVTEVV